MAKSPREGFVMIDDIEVDAVMCRDQTGALDTNTATNEEDENDAIECNKLATDFTSSKSRRWKPVRKSGYANVVVTTEPIGLHANSQLSGGEDKG